MNLAELEDVAHEVFESWGRDPEAWLKREGIAQAVVDAVCGSTLSAVRNRVEHGDTFDNALMDASMTSFMLGWEACKAQKSETGAGVS